MGKIINYALKAYILNECPDFLSLINISKKQYHLKLQAEENGVVSPFHLKYWRFDIPDFSELRYKYVGNDYYKINGYEPHVIFKECLRILHANNCRRERLQTRITDMLESDCLFLTLTFRDESFAKTTVKQRRVAVSRFLKSHNCKYVANIDFGADENCTHREHYHALVQCSKIDSSKWFEKYGVAYAEHVKKRNSAKLSKYIAKLTNHAIKETTKRAALIYSR